MIIIDTTCTILQYLLLNISKQRERIRLSRENPPPSKTQVRATEFSMMSGSTKHMSRGCCWISLLSVCSSSLCACNTGPAGCAILCSEAASLVFDCSCKAPKVAAKRMGLAHRHQSKVSKIANTTLCSHHAHAPTPTHEVQEQQEADIPLSYIIDLS